MHEKMMEKCAKSVDFHGKTIWDFGFLLSGGTTMASDLASPCACEDGAWRLSGVDATYGDPRKQPGKKKITKRNNGLVGDIYICIYIYNILYTY